MANISSASFIRPEDFWRARGLKAEQTVVHFGCGAGFYLVPAARIVGRKGRVIGIDVRADMLREAESRAERAGVADIVHTIRSNLENNHGSLLESSSADWTLVANIVHQADTRKILTEAQRITRQDSTIIVVEWDTVATPLGPPPQQRITKQKVLEVARDLGIGVRGEFAPSPYHYGLLLSPRI